MGDVHLKEDNDEAHDFVHIGLFSNFTPYFCLDQFWVGLRL